MINDIISHRFVPRQHQPRGYLREFFTVAAKEKKPDPILCRERLPPFRGPPIQIRGGFLEVTKPILHLPQMGS